MEPVRRTRIGRNAINALALRINGGLRDGLRVVVEGRYGYLGVDLYDKRGCVRTLSTGLSAREAHTFLSGMYEALDIVGRDV